jgi:hypothetical protein
MQQGPQLGRLSRRGFVGATVAAAALNALPTVSLTQDADELSRIIDVHCHIFNARDVPAVQFILRVVAREQELGMFATLAAIGAAILRVAAAPAATREKQDLDNGVRTNAIDVAPDAGFREQVVAALEETIQGVAVSRQPMVEDDDDLADLDGPAVLINGLYANKNAAALRALEDHYDIHGLLPSATPSVRTNGAVPWVNGASLARDVNINRMADAIVQEERAARSGAPSSTVGRYFMLIRVFCSYRAENVRKLDSAFEFSTGQRTRLYCPAIIDYDYWLGTSFLSGRTTPLLEQVETYGAVARHTDPNVLVAGFVAFDPLRAAIDELRGVQGYSSTLGVVQAAIEQNGFAGAKVYPPMGFRPWGNTTNGETYGPRVAKLLRNLHAPANYQLGEALDRALDTFYRYCLTNDVPILAHCSNSQSSFQGSGARAAPEYWRSLLDRGVVNGLDYRNLRVNLGHFGGLWCNVDSQKPGSDEEARCRIETAWPGTIIDMVTADNNGAPLYPNLSFDIADIGAVGDSDGRGRIVTYLSTILGTGAHRQRALSRAMYGTDWMFLAMSSFYRGFGDGARALAMDLGMDPRDLIWRNAARFLGLTQQGRTKSRLGTFYSGDATRAAALANLLL